MAAKIMGLKHIIVVDLRQNRLDLAKDLGATPVIIQSIHALRVSGTAAIVSMGGDVTLNFYNNMVKEILIKVNCTDHFTLIKF